MAHAGQGMVHDGGVSPSRNVGLLLTARAVSNLLSTVFNFAQGLYVMDQTGSAQAFSAVLVAFIVPRALLSGVAGVVVDRFDRRWLLIGTDVVAGVAVFAAWALFQVMPGQVPLLVGLAAVLGMIQALFFISLQASIPDLVGPEQVMRANGLLQAVNSATRILGPVLGAVGYRYLSLSGLFVLNGLSFLVAAGLELLLRPTHAPIQARESTSMVSAAREAWGFLTGHSELRVLLVLALVLQSTLDPMLSLVLPFLAYKVLGLEAGHLSLILSCAAAGAVLAGMSVSWRGLGAKLLPRFALLVLGQALLIGGLALPALWGREQVGTWGVVGLLLVLQVAVRVVNTLQNVPLYSHFLVHVPQELRGRVMGIFQSAMLLVVPGSMWLAGEVLERVSWPLIPLGACGVMAGVALVAAVHPGLRSLRAPFHNARQASAGG